MNVCTILYYYEAVVLFLTCVDCHFGSQMTRDVLEELELLDAALKRKQSPEEVKPVVQQLTERLQKVTDAINIVTAEAS